MSRKKPKPDRAELPAATGSSGLAKGRRSSFVHDSLAGRVLRRLPGGSFAESQIERIENRVLGELKRRLDDFGEPASLSVLAVSVGDPGANARRPGDFLRGLMERSVEQTREQAETEYFSIILRELVPDEARILAALSDGTAYPLIHVQTGPRLGMTMERVVECVSSVGKNAGVQCPELTPDYVRHLLRWGLVEVDPGETGDTMRYQLLETEMAVRSALDAAHKSGRRGQILRRTLRISEVGRRLWSACRLSGE